MRFLHLVLLTSAEWLLAAATADAQETLLYSPRKLTHYDRVRRQADLVSELADNYHRSQRVRAARQRGLEDSLHQVEKAAVPVPDDPPVRYPTAQTWPQFTARLRARASSTRRLTRAEREWHLRQALESPTEMEFNQVPLYRAVEYLNDLHGVQIRLDNSALAEADVGPNIPITFRIKGVSLKSALRLMLRQFDLTYVVAHEVILITSQHRAKDHVVTKAYYIGDLMMPRVPW